MSKLKETLNWLTVEGYLEDGKLTAKVERDLTSNLIAIYPLRPDECTAIVPFVTPSNWPDSFMKFIAEAQVPRMMEGKNREMYQGNKYSEPGMKAYRKALEKEGIQYDILVKSTMLYYKSSIRLKKAVGNYFAQGDWRTDYDALLQAAEGGEQTLIKHIKDETTTGYNGGYVIG